MLKDIQKIIGNCQTAVCVLSDKVQWLVKVSLSSYTEVSQSLNDKKHQPSEGRAFQAVRSAIAKALGVFKEQNGIR